MANANVTRLGQINGAGDTDALFLKVYAGEVLTAYETATVTESRHRVRKINSGKSAQFPATGKISGGYHTPGNELVGKTVNQAERVITIDSLLVSDAFVASIDEAKNHYDVRSIYSNEQGIFLGNNMDKNVLRVGVLAARAAATVTGGFGGSALTNANYGSDGAVLAGGIFAAAQIMDEKDIPASERYAYVKPAQYYLLAQTTNVINSQWGGEGSYAEGSVRRIADIPLVKTNNLPNGLNLTDDTTIAAAGIDPTLVPAAYRGNFTNTKALVLHKEAVGTVKLLDLGMEMAYDIRRQGTLIVAKYAVGHGALRPEGAVELKSA
ncbi:capsid protein [Methylovorus sp. MM2]|uniref:capsid protein n=1 Tax=Methylovorus sp. MM2 TaxID=1848038 RepID=UPI0007E014A6|nr:capsid protein [Methylovorus sp. MM2]OAM52921.1 capsid protein [Methylovorus sp. MM2]